MPWRETNAMDQRIQFVVRALEEEVNRSELCREFGISRKTGYKWLKRYGEVGSL
ncbi:MAG TPA: helix-turn-helix domain-containing protein, partial [Thermoanaerobaculia bacterium]|nr:helix-turn-helix domain-containing protein [Thermoanaerobaculia bacterium]